MDTPLQGAVLLAKFIKKHGLSQRNVARALNVSDPTVHDWLAGTRKPRFIHRKAIHIWTGGAVPGESWDTAQEQEALAELRPFDPAEVAK